MNKFAIFVVAIVAVILALDVVDDINDQRGFANLKDSQISTLMEENRKLWSVLEANQTEKDRLVRLVEKAFQQEYLGRTYSIDVTATAYTARSAETNSEPWFTASMSPSRVGVIAVSKDLEDEIGLKMGQFVLLEGLGLFRIEDRMNPRWKRRVDILHGNLKAARLFKKKNVRLTWLGG